MVYWPKGDFGWVGSKNDTSVTPSKIEFYIKKALHTLNSNILYKRYENSVFEQNRGHLGVPSSDPPSIFFFGSLNSCQALKKCKKSVSHLPILDPQNELFWGVVGVFCPPGGSRVKIAPTLGDPPMGRYYHVKIIAEANSALPPWAAALIEYLLRIRKS